MKRYALKNLSPINTLFLSLTPIAAILGIWGHIETVGFILPTLIGLTMGSPLGGLSIIGLLRIVFVHHHRHTFT